MMPVKSSDWMADLSYGVPFNGSIKIFRIIQDADFSQMDFPNITDLYSYNSGPDFTTCVNTCAQWNVGDAGGNAGTLDSYKGCSGVSWVNPVCYLKSGMVDWQENNETTKGAVSAFLHFWPCPTC